MQQKRARAAKQYLTRIADENCGQKSRLCLPISDRKFQISKKSTPSQFHPQDTQIASHFRAKV